MDRDMTVPCEDGLINLRVGAIIMKNGKILMVGNNRAEQSVYRRLREPWVALGTTQVSNKCFEKCPFFDAFTA